MTSTKSTSTTPQATKAVEERKATRTRKASTPTGPAANVAGAKALENRKGRTTKQPEVVTPDLVTDGQGAAVAIPEPTATQQVEVDRVERLRLAEAELKALKAWEQGGRKGDRPATPNHDAIKAGAAAPSSPAKAKAASAKGTSTRLSDEEVTKLVQEQIKAGVTAFATVLRNLRAAGHSVSQERCRTLFQAQLPTVPAAKAAAPSAKTTKAASTKKATTKTAASARKAS